MNVFCLTTGRSGSTTFAQSCGHSTNYTSGHETRAQYIGIERFNYPDFHIEADNRLTWFLGPLDEKFADAAIYVHLIRSREDTIASLSKQTEWKGGIMKAFGHGILMNDRDYSDDEWREIAGFYYDTVNNNIKYFLTGKPHVITIQTESPISGIQQLWDIAGIDGDFRRAISEWDTRYNAS